MDTRPMLYAYMDTVRIKRHWIISEWANWRLKTVPGTAANLQCWIKVGATDAAASDNSQNRSI